MSSSSKKKIIVAASGRGTLFQKVYEGIQNNSIPNAEIIGLITDRHQTRAEEFAKEKSIPVNVIDFSSFSERIDFERGIEEVLRSQKPNLFLTLGFKRVLPAQIVQLMKWKMINIHPSLLPSFPGLKPQKKAIDYGVRFSGATVHFIDEGLDTGPIIWQDTVEVLFDDSPEALANRILRLEHKIIVKSVALFCQDKLKIEGRRVKILP